MSAETVDLKAELRDSLARRGLDAPKRPYHAVRLYPNSGKIIPPEPWEYRPKRITPCGGCGRKMETIKPAPETPYCRDCRPAQ